MEKLCCQIHKSTKTAVSTFYFLQQNIEIHLKFWINEYLHFNLNLHLANIEQHVC